jgi:uncharacterized repeat protein (TIGR03803 family)
LGFGGVFKITPTGTFSVIYNFDGTAHGKIPRSGLTLSTDGNFYGTTWKGGVHNAGTIFKITPAGVLTVLHEFATNDGTNPYAPPIQGIDGSYYGTTSVGGSGSGTVYKITPSGAFTVLHTFIFSQGYDSVAPLLQGTDGSFYGTTVAGGVGDGTVFKITPAGVLTVLYSFDSTHGSQPNCPLIQGTDGNFYGTTSGGGSLDGGVVFKLTAAKVLTVFHNFDARPGSVDGKLVYAGLVHATDGNFYGVTSGGGTNGFGILYKITAASVNAITPGGTLKSNLKFRVTPTVLSFTPTSGPVGTSVTITGNSLTGATKVTFGGVKATVFTVNSYTQITAEVPVGAVTGKIQVTTSGGTASSPTAFTVN